MSESFTAAHSAPHQGSIEYFDLEPHAGIGSLVVVGVALASLIVGEISWLLRTLRRRRRVLDFRERVSRGTPPTLGSGPIELAGIVDADDSEAPISVRIVQRGVRTPQKHNPDLWRWSEQARTVVVRPFSLILNGAGGRVRVHCDERVLLQACAEVATVMDGNDAGERTWEARVQQGGRVAILGNLVVDDVAVASDREGYRGVSGQHALCMRAGEGARLRVVAENAGMEEDRLLARRYRYLNRAYALMALICVVTTSVFCWELHESRTVVGTISGLYYCTSSKGNSRYSCFDAAYPVVLSGDITVSRVCRALPWDPDVTPPERLPGGDRVLISFLPGDPSRCNVGTRLKGSLWELVLLTLIPIAAGGAAAVTRWRPGARGVWFEREALNDEELE